MLPLNIILRKTDMLNTTKALLAVIVIVIFIALSGAVWVATPQHSGVVLSTMLITLPFAAVFIAWIYDTPHTY